MKTKFAGILAMIILIGFVLGGCGCMQQKVKGETPPPPACPPAIVQSCPACPSATVCPPPVVCPTCPTCPEPPKKDRN